MRAVSAAILAAVPVGLSACATAHEKPHIIDAILLNPQDTSTRQAIRLFVREKSGANVISNPDSLALSPVLANHQRRTNIGRRDMRSALKPVGNYRLVMDEINRCWLIHQLQDSVSQMELPSSANCVAYRAL